jgi:hypothetical protein
VEGESARLIRSTRVSAIGPSFMAVLVRSTPPPKPKANAPTTVPTPRRYEDKEKGIDISLFTEANARIAQPVPQNARFGPEMRAFRRLIAGKGSGAAHCGAGPKRVAMIRSGPDGNHATIEFKFVRLEPGSSSGVNFFGPNFRSQGDCSRPGIQLDLRLSARFYGQESRASLRIRSRIPSKEMP